jgi:Ca2+-binding RTX toxin-like protein
VLGRVVIATGLLALVLAPNAPASTAEMSNGYLVYLAGGGEANVVSIVHSEDGLITVTDRGAVIQPSNGCVSKDVHVVECGHAAFPDGRDLTANLVDLGDQNDSFDIFGLEPGEFIDYDVGGGTGDDILLGGGENDSLSGEAGVDRLEGGNGDDQLDGGADADVMRGGFGIDTVSYAGRSASVRVEIGDGPGDGEPGEGDDVQADNVVGGDGDDVLVGNEVANTLDGGLGDDRIRCRAGLDTALLTGSDLPADNCEQVAHDTLLRIGMTRAERAGRRHIQATVRRPDDNRDPRPAVATGELYRPCGPVRDDGTRCWRRIGRSHGLEALGSGESAVVDIILSRAGRRWLRDHPRRRPRLTTRAYLNELPDHPVELRLRVHVPRA